MDENKPIEAATKKPSFNIRKVLSLTPYFLLIISIGATIYFMVDSNSRRHKVASLEIEKRNLMTQNTDLVLKEKDLRAEIESLTQVSKALGLEAQKQTALNELSKSISLYFADKFDVLDAILVDSDASATDYINWIKGSALFSQADGTLDQANYRWGVYLENHKNNGIKYLNLKTEVGEYIADLAQLFKVQQPTGGSTY